MEGRIFIREGNSGLSAPAVHARAQLREVTHCDGHRVPE
jgi:hypothetical protein